MTTEYAYRDALNHNLIICWCGYNSKEDYFESCRRNGGTIKTRLPGRFLGCIGCGRIINPRTLEIVGENRKLIVGEPPIQVRELQFLGRLKHVAFWPTRSSKPDANNEPVF